MDTVVEKQYTISQLRGMLRQAKTVEEIRELTALFPVLSDDERKEGHRRLDDGIYDSEGILIGEKNIDSVRVYR
jgi:hypothetical protein